MTTWTDSNSIATTWTAATELMEATLYDDTNSYDVSLIGAKGYYYNQDGISWGSGTAISTTWTEL